MRSETTHHTLPLLPERATRTSVNVAVLLNALKKAAESASNKGKKRARDTSADAGRRRKRTKRSSSTAADAADDASSSDSATQTIPVYTHRMEIEYTSPAETDRAEDGEDQDMREELPEEQVPQWRTDLAALKAWLNEHSESSGDIEFTSSDLGYSKFTKITVWYANEVLFTLPALHEDFDLGAHDFRLQHLHDPLVAFLMLALDQRAEISGRLFVSPGSEPDTALRLSVSLDVSFVTPEIFDQIALHKRTEQSELEEAQRRALLHLFPYSSPPPSFHGEVDIPLLHSIVGPAPAPPASVPLEALQPAALLPTLLPFQRRSVAWLLAREGKTLSADGEVVPLSPNSAAKHLLWEEVQVNDEEHWFVDRLRGIISPEKPEDEAETLGGILAEEPGLGKTLECIALVMLNPAPGRNPATSMWDPETQMNVKEIKTTLIVTPASLATQWADELALHAPSLKVLVYDGWSKVPVPIMKAAAAKAHAVKKGLARSRVQSRASSSSSKSSRSKRKSTRRAPSPDAISEPDETDDTPDWCDYVNSFDVCITTYNVLQQDLNVARVPPRRPRRVGVEYSGGVRARSPLVMVEWLRVIMDEVQMGGGRKAEEMVSLIPRRASFAVSGTPARAQVADLVHVMRFLRVRAVDAPRVWTRLLKPGYVEEFVSLFEYYTVRTMKSLVQDELTIPQQTRYLVPIELGKVERMVYDQDMERALLQLGLDTQGVAVKDGWEVDTQVLRFWLRKLRQICTHPQVGQLQNRMDKLYKPGVLKTIGEVLEGMKDQNWRTLVEDRKEKVQTLTAIAQLLQLDETNPERSYDALNMLRAAEKEARALIADVESVIEEHDKKGEQLKEEAMKLRASRISGTPAAEPGMSTSEKGRARSSSIDPDEDSEDEDADLPKTPAGEEHKAKKTALQHRLRECRMTLHKVHFFLGNVYNSLGEAYTEQEVDAYAAAEELRRMLLKGTEEVAQKAMNQLSRKAQADGFKEAELVIPVPYLGKGGIRSDDLMEEANEIIQHLNGQSDLLWKWRSKLVTLLTKSLTTRDEAADGEEYARSLDTQGEAEAYLQAYAALLADRREALLAERTLLDTHDVQEKKTRQTKAAQRAQGAFIENEEDTVQLDKLDETEVLPEHTVLLKDLNDERKALLEEFDSERAVKSVMVDLSSVAARLVRENDPEKIIAKDAAKRLRELLADQAKLTEKLRADLVQLRRAFNERISYFRQLQEISDTVTAPTWEGSLPEAISVKRGEIVTLDHSIMTGRARRRYLRYLADSQEDGTVDEDQRFCVLCRCEFKKGYITQCAHVFCEACLRQWVSRPEGKACPVCRLAIKRDQLQRFSLNMSNPVPEPPQRIGHNEPAPKSHREIQYNVINREVFEGIQETESLGSYGSKIQTLVRHLLYLNNLEPGTKSIIFSAWAESLSIIQHALVRNGITCIRIDQSHGKKSAAKIFRTNPDISVLLLHGERENAGLNVTCASRVFLVESVVHHAFELQAIARIDRMGQTRPTEVYCYYAEETVERNILDLAAKRGQSLYTKDNSGGTVNVTQFALDSSEQKAVDAPAKKGQKGDFVYKTEDMLAIFFPHLFEDIEYLIPEDELMAIDASDETGVSSLTNSVAGPSRL